MAVKGRQGIITRANNPNAKYKIKVKKYQYITGDDNQINVLYGYSRLISSSATKKYSYAVQVIV